MSDYTTNFPPQTYSSSFYLNSLVDDEKSALVCKSDISREEETANSPLLDCFISTMARLLNTVQKVAFLVIYFQFSSAQSPTKECKVEETPKTISFATLNDYQGSRHSFDPHHQTYQGNFVEFTFKNIDNLETNSFISFGSNSIIKIDLNNKGIQTVEDGAFNGLFCLHYLELSHNNISLLTEDVFKGLANLRQLNLSGNLFEHIASNGLVFRHLRSLEVLNLSQNRIRLINTLAFANLTKLKVLNLGFNKIRTFSPLLFSSLQSLTELHLNNNLLGDVEPEKWTGLAKLLLLDLAENSLTKFDSTYNFSFSNLERLNLSGNLLSSLNVFPLRKHLPKLESIDITENNWQCEDLDVVKFYLSDSKISLAATPNCSIAGPYKQPTTEEITSSAVVTATTAATRKSRDYSKEVFVQNGEVLLTNKKVLENTQHLENILVYLFIIVVVFIIIDMSVRIGICHNLYSRITERGRHGYVDERDTEHLILMRR